MSIANQEGNVEIYIRGVGSSNNTELGDPGAASHLNGIYIPRPRGLGLMFYDLDRVEVNKGPQGTLYGRNAMAGTLNILTAKPKLGQTSGFAQAEVSNRSGQGFEGAVNAPVGENAAIRAAVVYTKKDYGFENYSASILANTANPTAAQKAAGGLNPAGAEKNYAGRVSLLWDISPMVRFTAMVDGGHEGGTGYPGANVWGAVQATGARSEELDIRNVVYRGPQGETSNDLWGVQSKLDFDLGNGIGIEASGSVRSVDFYQRNAASEGVAYPGRNYSGLNWDNYSTQYWQTKSKSTIGELRAYSTDPKARLKWSAGAFGFNEDQQVGYVALADAGYCCYSGTEFTMPSVKGKAAALYTDANFSLSENLRVLGGARYTKEEKSRFGIGGNIALTLGGDALRLLRCYTHWNRRLCASAAEPPWLQCDQPHTTTDCAVPVADHTHARTPRHDAAADRTDRQWNKSPGKLLYTPGHQQWLRDLPHRSKRWLQLCQLVNPRTTGWPEFSPFWRLSSGSRV